MVTTFTVTLQWSPLLAKYFTKLNMLFFYLGLEMPKIAKKLDIYTYFRNDKLHISTKVQKFNKWNLDVTIFQVVFVRCSFVTKVFATGNTSLILL